MKFKTVNAESRAKIEAASEGRIKFITIDNKVVRVDLIDASAGRVSIVVDSYSVSVVEPEKKTVYGLSWQQKVPGNVLAMERSFDSDAERSDFIRNNFFDVDESELLLTETEEICSDD